MYAFQNAVQRIRFGVPGRIAHTKSAALARHIQRFKSSASVRVRRGSVHRIGWGAPSVLVRTLYILAGAAPSTFAGNIRSGARNRIVGYKCVRAAKILRILVLFAQGWDGSVRSIRTCHIFHQQMVHEVVMVGDHFQGAPLFRIQLSRAPLWIYAG